MIISMVLREVCIEISKHKTNMFKSIIEFFRDQTLIEQNSIDEQYLMHLAAAALLLEVSRADFDVQDKELVEIARALQSKFKFSQHEVEKLLKIALSEQESHISIHPFVKIINEACSHEEKKLLLVDLWRVAYADNKLDKYEEYQIRKIAELLYLTHSEFIQTKLKVLDSE